MKKKIIFAALAAAFAVCASGQCMDESALAWRDGAQTADDMMFLGVDLRHVPQWDGDVIGVAHGEKGCVPIRYRTKEVKLAFPFIGFKSMTLCSCYLTGCNCDSLGVRSVHLKRRESAGNGVFDEKKARQWLEVAANAIRDKFGVDMKLECESERVIAMIGENDCLQFYCSVCLGKTETSDGWSSEVIKTHAMMYNLYVNKKGCKGPEPAPRPSETQEIEVEVDI